MNKQELIEYKEDLEREMNDISVDFCANQTADDSAYICDAITEYADNEVHIYYSDIFDFAKEHYDYVEQAIEEFGVATNGKKVDLLRTIQQGEFLYNEEQLYDDLEDIVKLVAVNHLIDNDIELDEEQTEELFDKLEGIDNNDRFDDILDAIKDVMGGEEDESNND